MYEEYEKSMEKADQFLQDFSERHDKLIEIREWARDLLQDEEYLRILPQIDASKAENLLQGLSDLREATEMVNTLIEHVEDKTIDHLHPDVKEQLLKQQMEKILEKGFPEKIVNENMKTEIRIGDKLLAAEKLVENIKTQHVNYEKNDDLRLAFKLYESWYRDLPDHSRER